MAQPLQEELAERCQGPDQRWDEWFQNPIELDHARELVMDTRGYLQDVPEQASAINTQLMEIMMAQDFQDLTGQVIKKMMEVVNDVETQLAAGADRQRAAGEAQLKCGTQSNLHQRPADQRRANPEAVTDQAQVDDLLESLGF